jgi:hypothetical protein
MAFSFAEPARLWRAPFGRLQCRSEQRIICNYQAFCSFNMLILQFNNERIRSGNADAASRAKQVKQTFPD